MHLNSLILPKDFSPCFFANPIKLPVPQELSSPRAERPVSNLPTLLQLSLALNTALKNQIISLLSVLKNRCILPAT